MFGIISGKILVTFLQMLPLFHSLWSVLLELPQGMCWTLMPLNLLFFSVSYLCCSLLYEFFRSVFQHRHSL